MRLIRKVLEWLGSQPSAPRPALSKEGFGLHMGLALSRHWPDVPLETAKWWMWEYLDANDVCFGDDGHDWTREGAAALASAYAADFGE